MRKILLLWVALVVPEIGFGMTPDSVFFQAGRLYQEGFYEESASLYESLYHSGFESYILFYNTGNAFFRSNKLGKARLYYERALSLNPNDSDTRANLDYLTSLLADRFEEVPEFFVKKWLRTFVSSLSSNYWAYISMASFFLAIISIGIYLLLKNRSLRKIGFYSFIFLFTVSLISFSASWKQSRTIIKPDAAVVIDLLVNARSAPRDSGTPVFVLHEGAKVGLGDKTGGWQEIKLSDGRKAWVPETTLETI